MVLSDMIQGSSPDAAFRCNRADCGDRVHQCFFPAADKAAGAFRRSKVMSMGYNEHIGAVGAISAQHGFEDQRHQWADDVPVLLAPRVDQRRPARPRRVPAAKRTRIQSVRPHAHVVGIGSGTVRPLTSHSTCNGHDSSSGSPVLTGSR